MQADEQPEILPIAGPRHARSCRYDRLQLAVEEYALELNQIGVPSLMLHKAPSPIHHEMAAWTFGRALPDQFLVALQKRPADGWSWES